MKRLLVLLLTVMLIAAMAVGCSTQKASSDDDDSSKTEADVIAATADSAGAAQKTVDPDTGVVTTTANVTANGAIDATDLFSDRDLRQTADLSEATEYTLSDDSDITITKAGVYVISGSASNASIIVEADKEDKVQIVLSGVSITNSSAPAIYVKNADKVFVTTAEDTTNTLSVTGSFSSDGDTNTDAVIFSKDDLVLNGLGSLEITSSENGISGKDDVKITGGTIHITSTADAIEAKDSIAVADGAITINTDKDALHAENDEDNTVGYVYICGGTLTITAGSDGIQAITIAQIDGGSFGITSREGIEATNVQINGGTINISASDDGINGSQKSTAYSPKIEINGGELTINMGQGDTDGIDVNGDLYINGGTISVNANSPFDYDGQGQLNGGTVYVNGEQTTELTNQMMGGGPGGMGGDGGRGGNMGGGNPGGAPNMGGNP